MSDVRVYKFQKVYRALDNKFLKADKELFELGVLVAYTSEVKKGFMVERQLKTTASGTKFNYKSIESQEEADIYIAKIKEMSSKIDPDIVNSKIEKLVEKISKE